MAETTAAAVRKALAKLADSGDLTDTQVDDAIKAAVAMREKMWKELQDASAGLQLPE